MKCTCAGTAPGYPAHEDWCGRDEEEEWEAAVRDRWAAFLIRLYLTLAQRF